MVPVALDCKVKTVAFRDKSKELISKPTVDLKTLVGNICTKT
jgi:hypothetical protein